MERTRRLAIALFVIVAMLAPVSRGTAFAQADDLTCDDFTNQDAAQIVLDADDSFADALDEDGDGDACPDLPARDKGNTSNGDVVLGIGYTRDLFEGENGKARNDDGANDFEVGEEYTGIGDYPSISIFWDNDFAVHIIVELDEELDEDAAVDAAAMFLPSTADLETTSEELDDEELLFTGKVDDLETIFDQDVYDEYEVGGEPGDVRIILVPGKTDYATLDIAIGLGEEYAGGSGTTDPDPTKEPDDPSGETEEYLQTVRDSSDVFLEEIGTFNDLFLGSTELTDAELDQLVDILVHWSAATLESSVLTAPDGLEDIQSTFEDGTVALEDVSAIFAEGEDADVDAAVTSLEEAETAFNDLDDLLTDEGV